MSESIAKFSQKVNPQGDFLWDLLMGGLKKSEGISKMGATQIQDWAHRLQPTFKTRKTKGQPPFRIWSSTAAVAKVNPNLNKMLRMERFQNSRGPKGNPDSQKATQNSKGTELSHSFLFCHIDSFGD